MYTLACFKTLPFWRTISFHVIKTFLVYALLTLYILLTHSAEIHFCVGGMLHRYCYRDFPKAQITSGKFKSKMLGNLIQTG